MFKSDLTIRDCQTFDLPEVLSIERQAQEVPWSRLSFEEALTHEHICRVIEEADNQTNSIVAFSIISQVLNEVHVLNLAVTPCAQGRGFGHVLLEDIIQQAQSNQCQRIFLEVRQSNIIAQDLYQKWGFKQISIRKNYYRRASSKTGIAVSMGVGQKEDAYVFLKQL